MATFNTYDFSSGAQPNLRKLAPPSMFNPDARLRGDQGTVNDDLADGCAAGATITGPARAYVGGQRIYVAGSASARGSLLLEVSSDGGKSWRTTDGDDVPAGEYVVGSASTSPRESAALMPFAPEVYRLRFVCGPNAASRVTFSSQVLG